MWLLNFDVWVSQIAGDDSIGSSSPVLGGVSIRHVAGDFAVCVQTAIGWFIVHPIQAI
jgi:hypothetical protein